MRRHGPHILSLLKGSLLCLSLVLFIRLGFAAEWRAFLGAYFYAWPPLVVPAYWASLIVGGFLLTFPITLTQDHLARSAEGHHEEMPATYWLHGLGMETLIGTIVGCIIVALMIYVPSLWWLAWTALWTTYHFTAARAPELSVIQSDDDERPSHSSLAAALRPLLAPAGLNLDQAYSLDEPTDEWSSDKDLVLKYDGTTSTVYLPDEWISQWETDEIAAVILHKAWLTHHRFQRLDLVINGLTALACFGLFAAMEYISGVSSGADPIIRTTGLFAWTIAMLFLFQLPALAYYRMTMVAADDAVVRQMTSPAALIRVLERAHQDSPPNTEAPRWAEYLFYNTPSLSHRIDRLKSHPAFHPAT